MEAQDRRFVLTAGALLAALGLASAWLAPGLLSPDWVRRFHRSAQDSEVVAVYLSPLFWGLLGLVLVFERVLPARRQPVLSLGMVQDAVYFVLILLFRILLLSLYVKLLRFVYLEYLSFLTVRSVEQWPSWAKGATAIAITDFLGWFHHLVRHKVPLFWRFHAIHHSQRQLNLFTDLRYHPFEYLVTQTILFIPMFMFGAAFPVLLAYAFFQQWFTKFYHGNVRTDLGPLRFLLVTPQSHRIHHSARPEHRDRNYGVVFSIWDWVLGTQHREHREYPETGIDDSGFPHETGVRGLSLLRAPWQQFLYPFRRPAAG
jgi:sterol desaturase/sphingolipid hydroxylase (fatty acid hydroxylase superfamily)